MATVRRLAGAAELVPEGRAVFVAPDEGDAFRLWVLTPPLEPVGARLLDALVERDEAKARGALDDVERARDALIAARGHARAPGGAGGVAVQDGRVAVLGVEDGGEPVDEHARALAARATEGDAEGAALLARAGRGRSELARGIEVQQGGGHA